MAAPTAKVETMTFVEFQKSRVWSDDLGAVLQDKDNHWAGEPASGRGLIYPGILYIEQSQPHWPVDARVLGD